MANIIESLMAKLNNGGKQDGFGDDIYKNRLGKGSDENTANPVGDTGIYGEPGGASSEPADMPVKNTGKPEGWTDDQYNEALKYYKPEAISKYFGGDYQYDPNEGPFLQTFIESAKKPDPIDEKNVQRARLAAGIGDSLGLIAQMIGASKGAHIGKRDASQSALARVIADEEKLRNLYMQQDNDYRQGLYGARARDLMQGLQDHRYNQQNIQNILVNKDKMDKDAIQAEVRNEQWKKGHNLAVDKFEENKRHAKITEGMQAAQISIQRDNTKANKEHREAELEARRNARAGKTIPLYFKDGTSIDVPESTWKANYPVLIDILLQSGKVAIPTSWSLVPPTAQQAEYFIKQNKDALPKEAREFLSEISKGYPSQYGEEEDEFAEFAED
jgi:hypothetical protein